MRIPTSALVAASLFAASLAPAGAAIHIPAAGSIITHPNIVTKVIPRSEAAKYLNPALVHDSVRTEGLKRALKMAPSHMKAFRTKLPPGTITNFLSDDSGYIFELAGSKVVGYLTDCSGAEGMKVDHSGNLWVACTNTGTVNEYAPGASSATLTLVDNPGGATYYTADVAVDSAGDVWASSLYAFYCSSYYCYFEPGQVSFWAAGSYSNGSSPTGTVTDTNINEEGFFLDASPSGSDVYVDYEECTSTTCGFAADDISGSTITQFAPIGSISFPGGLYYTGTGTVNLLDQDAHVITVFSGDVATGAYYGPTPENLEGGCDPVDTGYNLGDSEVAIGDAGCHSLDEGKLAAHHGHGSFKAKPNINFSLPIGAAFSPSDK